MKNLQAVPPLPLALLLVAALAPDAFGCSCVPVRRPFLMAARESPWVVRGRVLRHTGGDPATRYPDTEMDVEVLEVLAGEVEKKVIGVSGDPGNQCRPYVAGFPVGTEWVLALGYAAKSKEDVEALVMPGPDKGDYSISSCGTYWLAVKDGKVAGDILVTPGSGEVSKPAEKHELSLDELRGHFKAATKKTPGG